PTFGGGVIFVANSGSSLLAIRPGGEGDVTESHVLWKNEDTSLPDLVSPITDGERILLFNYGTLVCHAASDGRLLWEQSLEGMVSSSPVLAGGRFYLSDREGTTRIIESADAFRQVGRGEVGEPIHGTPAFVDDRIYI